MALDTLSVGGIIFDGFSAPESMMGGGRQSLTVHKMPGGSRVVDVLGTDPADIAWSGQFYGDDAMATCLALDGIKDAGQEVPLVWGGGARTVVISEFLFHVKRYPVWVEYSITCVVSRVTAGGGLGGIGGVAGLIAADLASAIGL